MEYLILAIVIIVLVLMLKFIFKFNRSDFYGIFNLSNSYYSIGINVKVYF